MRQLTPLDTMFLLNESPTSSHHVSDILVFEAEGPGLSLPELRRFLEQRIHLLPPLRERLVEVPFGLDEPFWLEDPEFDLDEHLFEHTVLAPGDDEQLAELAAFITASPLNRFRPLWELHLVHGLAGGRKALIKKFHHAALDGESNLELTSILLDASPEPRQVPPPSEPWVPDQLPGVGELMMRGFSGLAQRPLRMLDAKSRLVARCSDPGLALAAARMRGEITGLTPTQPSSPPRTPLNVRVSTRRRVAFVDVSLTQIRAVTSAFGVSVNDVIVAMCAAVLRGWLIDRNALPAQPLVVCMPISVRTEAERGFFGNRVSTLIATLPTHLDDPVLRLKAMHESKILAKIHHDAIGGNLLGDMGEFVMPAMQISLNDWMTSMGWPAIDKPPVWNVAISNLSGPASPLYLSGHRLAAHYPVGMVMDGQALMITVARYRDKIGFGLVADRHVVPDLWEMVAGLPVALDQLEQASRIAAA